MLDYTLDIILFVTLFDSSEYDIITAMSIGKRNPRTKGLSYLTAEEQAELLNLLRKTGTRFRTVHTKGGDEIVLLKITANGVIPQIFKLLQQAGAELLDLFQNDS